ncbi:MAG: MoxR family ATPase [Crocosphaera sp.]|uniref:AAA family ATPase n=1 Tax=Crocosphaera sp. TaxID=2729996 RepID=UPI00258E9719|nr:MoxR family ATPase [Crocosphaera sp.]MCH2247055.1 MoxR family ATPase [Crocosphaera sp.]
MNNELEYNYTGKPEHQPSEPTIDSQGRKLFPYLPDDDLVQAVNLAIALERPLLIQGEPGCGKTLLARAIAYEFGQKYLQKTDKYPYYRWNITSRSQAQEGRYTFDALGKLRDAQMVNILGENYLVPEDRKKLIERLKKENCEDYVNYGALGQAFQEENYRPILLIDEIDKADIDFPNDLLAELEEPSFTIVETQKTVNAKKRPIVIITSNSERELPEAFLRRCLFYWLKFPEEQRLKEIINLHFPQPKLATLFDEAIAKFQCLREETKVRSTSKQVSTSELLDWLRILTNKPIDEALKDINNLFENAAQLGILLKSKTDLERLYQPTKSEVKTETSEVEKESKGTE